MDAILRAAALLLVEEGFTKASTNAIAARAGVSIGSLYQYFDGKDSIFLALMARHSSDVGKIVQAHLSQMDDPRTHVVAALRRMMLDLVELHEQDPEVLGAMERELAPLLARHEREKHAEFDRLVQRVEGQLVMRGARRSKLTRSAAWLLATTVSGVAHRVVHEAPAGIDRQATIRNTLSMVEGLLAGIGIG